MKVLIVYWHPEPASFNAAMLRTASRVLTAEGHEVQISDLNEMAFNPVSGRHNFITTANPDYFKQQDEEAHAARHDGFAEDCQSERQKLAWCDLLIFQFPLWWCGMPAMMKGWVDRVFTCQHDDETKYRCDAAPFREKRAMLSLTTGGPASQYSADGPLGAMPEVLSPIHKGMLALAGFQVLEPFVAYQPACLCEHGRIALLEQYTHRLQGLEQEAAIPFPSLCD
ncbi:NAD(P)H-dependent oxidoreductase [Oceanimonas sp. MB9]|uniref:NAD(P)H-dependent oxidoreductase n=1 Tax=Oceanimonas sp. MB9 TaxID=2588453 RepID=UPI0013F5B942|nr:NAD(P)H-dependent oxidoreductase [Oceanimonas sp. MB9]NHI00221.1 General stress protein 14 [Oceanimonas sp. MB9]